MPVHSTGAGFTTAVSCVSFVSLGRLCKLMMKILVFYLLILVSGLNVAIVDLQQTTLTLAHVVSLLFTFEDAK